MRILCIVLTLSFCTFDRATAQDLPFVRGDSNDDGSVDLSDALNTLGVLFLGTGELRCRDAADYDDSGAIEITDAIATLGYLFLGGGPPSAPFPDCGPDSTLDDLSCEEFTSDDCGTGTSSPLLAVLRRVSTIGTERCCSPLLGVDSVRVGSCEAIGGAVLDPDALCESPADIESSPGLLWVHGGRTLASSHPEAPPHSVTVLTTRQPNFNVVSFEVILPEPGAPDGAGGLVVPLVTVDLDPDILSDRRVSAELDLSFLRRGRYTLRATGWQTGASVPDTMEFVLSREGEDIPPDAAAPRSAIRAIASFPGQLEVRGHLPPVLEVSEMAQIEAVGVAGDPELLAELDLLQSLSTNLEFLESTILNDVIGGLRSDIESLDDRLEVLRRRLAELLERLAENADEYNDLVREQNLLSLVNRILDDSFGDFVMDLIKDLIKQRESLLDGTREEDRASLATALDEKQRRLTAVDDEILRKQQELAAARVRHRAMKADIRAKYLEAFHVAGGNAGANIDIQDGGVDYDIYGILFNSRTSEVTKYAPTGEKFKERKAELDALIEEYRKLWQDIQDCEDELTRLLEEKAWLEQNIASLENGASEIDEIDEILDQVFDPARIPYLRRILERLREIGAGWLADILEDLLAGDVPRDCDAHDGFAAALEALRDAKHAREDKIADAIEENDREGEADETEAGGIRGEIDDVEDEIERRKRDLEDAIRRATEAERQEREEARRRAEAAAERAARDEHIRDLHERAKDGDTEALQELAELLGLTLLDELSGSLKLGTIIGGLLTAADTANCICPILEALEALLAPRNRSDRTVCVYAQAYVNTWLDCGGLDVLRAIHGEQPLVDSLKEMVESASAESLRRAAAAVQRARRLQNC